MDWLAAAHLHPIDQVWTRSCIVLPLFALGFSRATFGGFLAFTTFQAIFVHANVRLTFGPLRWVIATPEFHHWHHANDPAAYNSNFAGEFPWIDALFGTLYLPAGQMPAGYGVDDHQPPGYLAQLAWPFRPQRFTQQSAATIESSNAS
jgi:sterol desaturase/sphingolipid hydroxylase (fatty acid hydroxylase superfamily)